MNPNLKPYRVYQLTEDDKVVNGISFYDPTTTDIGKHCAETARKSGDWFIVAVELKSLDDPHKISRQAQNRLATRAQFERDLYYAEQRVSQLRERLKEWVAEAEANPIPMIDDMVEAS